MSSGIGRASKAKKKLERLGYVEGEEMTMEAFDNIWHSYNGNKFALPDSEARKFLKDFWAVCSIPFVYEMNLTSGLSFGLSSTE